VTVAATIEIVPTAPPWHIFARLSRITIKIDGEMSRLRWGTHAFAVAPGNHTVNVSLGLGRSPATLDVTVAGGQILRLRYEPRWIAQLPGKLEIERLPPAQLHR
jgi:hypothetical protein